MRTERNLWHTVDGRLVPAGHPDAAVLAIPAGTEVAPDIAAIANQPTAAPVRTRPEGAFMTRTQADRRVYRTVDGELVGDQDPRGAFLAYAPGDEVNEREADAYRKMLDERPDDAPTGAEVALEQALNREARANPTPPVFVHHEDVTAAANAMRIAANNPALREVPASHGEIATRRLFRTLDGRLVNENDPDAATLAYPVGALVPNTEVPAMRKLNEDTDSGTAGDDAAEATDAEGSRDDKTADNRTAAERAAEEKAAEKAAADKATADKTAATKARTTAANK